MAPWEGTRQLIVISACMTAAGKADFMLNHVEVTHDQYENGIHLYLAEAELLLHGFEEPFTHFDEFEAPAFLLPAVQEYLGLSSIIPDHILTLAEEEA